MPESISILQLGDLKVAEVGTEREVEITQAVTDFRVELSSRQPSSIMFKVYDPNFKMFYSNYFQVRRELSYGGNKYEIAAATIQRNPMAPDTVDIRAGSRAIQKMRRDKGAFTWNAITAAEFAKQKAEEFGMEMFIQQSTEVDSITRMQSDTRDESTWDVLQRLASDLEYQCFEAYNVLYFSSEDYLLERQPHITVNIGSGSKAAQPEEAWYPYAFTVQTNDDDWAGSSLTVKVHRENGLGLRPGMGIVLENAGTFGNNRKHLVTDIKWPVGTHEPVTVSARTLIETNDTVADSSVGRGVIPFGSRNLEEGDTGEDVKRLQMAIGMSENLHDGVFGSQTVAAVKAWQRENKLGVEVTTLISDVSPADRSFFGDESQITTYNVDGIIDADDWAVLLAADPTTRRYTAWADVDMTAYATAWRESTQQAGAVLPSDGSVSSSVNDADRKYFY